MSNNNYSCKIHEFRTGIAVITAEDGKSFKSAGFKGALDGDAVPIPVQQAIKNNEFEVAEEHRGQMAVIGRVVKCTGFNPFSVVAFISLPKDNRGRDLQLYSYFCCEAANETPHEIDLSMINILYRVVNYAHRNNGSLPFFNQLGMANLDSYSNEVSPEIDRHISFSSEQLHYIVSSPTINPLVLQPKFIDTDIPAYTLLKLQSFTWQRAQEINQLANIAWAYNVQALMMPDSFVVIQAENDEAYETLKNIKADYFISGIDKQGLKDVISGIMQGGDIRSEDIFTFDEILEDEKLKELNTLANILSKIFDDLGIKSNIPFSSSSISKVKAFGMSAWFLSKSRKERRHIFFKWFEEQDPSYKGIKTYLETDQNFFDILDTHPKKTVNLRRIIGDISLEVIEELLIKDISPARLNALIQNSRWIEKQNLLVAIRDGIAKVDSAVNENAPFSGADIWKPLESFIQNVRRLKVTSGNPIQGVQSNSELPKWLKNILPEFISDHLADRWRDINASQKKRAEAKEQENRLIKAEAYYSPLAELLRMLCPNTVEHLYFDYISNPQKRLPLSYSAIGVANNDVEKRFNLTIGKPISIDKIENKLIWQYISFFFLTLISVIVLTVFYLGFSIIVLIGGSLWNFIKYIFNRFIHILKQIFNWTVEGGGSPHESVEKFIKDQITKLLSVDYSNAYYSKSLVLSSIELTFKKLANHSEKEGFEITKTVLEELESDLKSSKVHDSLAKIERLKFFRVYFLSNDLNEINQYLGHLQTLEDSVQNTTLNFQNGFRKILKSIKEDSQHNTIDNRDYAEPIIKDVVDFILSKVIDNERDGNAASYQNIIDWIISRRSFVSYLDLIKYITEDIKQFIKSDDSETVFKCNSNFWEELNNSWQYFKDNEKRKTASKYQNLARFLKDLSEALRSKNYEEYKNALVLSAYFSQISQGCVPEDVFQQFVSPQNPISPVVYGLKLLNPSGNQSTKLNTSDSSKKTDYFKWIANGIVFIILLVLCLFALKPSFNTGAKLTPEITNIQTPTPTVSSSFGENPSNVPSPKPEIKPARAKLTCKAIISNNNEDIDLKVSGIPENATEINALIYVLNDENGKLALSRYYPTKIPQLTNKKAEVVIRNMDGNGAPMTKTIYYIIASTQKIKDYKSAEDFNNDSPRFKPIQDTEDPCYVFITTP